MPCRCPKTPGGRKVAVKTAKRGGTKKVARKGAKPPPDKSKKAAQTAKAKALARKLGKPCKCTPGKPEDVKKKP